MLNVTFICAIPGDPGNYWDQAISVRQQFMSGINIGAYNYNHFPTKKTYWKLYITAQRQVDNKFKKILFQAFELQNSSSFNSL